MKTTLALCLLSFGLMILACSKKLDELDPNKGSMSITIEGVTYNFDIDYGVTEPQKTNAVFVTAVTAKTTTLTATNATDGTTFILRLDNKAIQTGGNFTVSPTDETGSVNFIVKNNTYRQSYQEACNSKLLYTNVNLNITRMSKDNMIVMGTFNGKMTKPDGEQDCPGLKMSKWKQVDITGAFSIRWQLLP